MVLVKNVVLAVIVTLFLVGCQDSNSEVKTVEYFKANSDALAAQIKECVQHPKKIEDTNCVTAKQAMLQKSAGERHDTSGFVYDKETWGKQW